MKKKLSLFITIISLAHFILNSQNNWDSTKYVKYSDRLVLTCFVSTRRFNCNIDQLHTEADSGKALLNYNAEANQVTGLQMNYDKLALGFGWNSGSPDLRLKGKTYYRDFSISFGENKWILDASYRAYTGFYEENSPNYLQNFQNGDPYLQVPGMEIRQIRGRFRYFTNHRKFAYSAGYGYTCRQLKSAFTWVLGGGFVNNRIGSDSSLFYPNVRTWYASDSAIKSLNMSGVSFGGGISANIVIFKRLFMNLTFNAYLEPQLRKYQNLDGTEISSYKTSSAVDSRFAMGYNGRKFFIFINGTVDYNNLDADKMRLATRFISGSFNIGYRFKVKCPKFYSDFKETKMYKLL